MAYSSLSIDLDAEQGKEVRIDGKTMEELGGNKASYCLEPFFFVETMLGDGNYFIFVCSCRDEGCGGWFECV